MRPMIYMLGDGMTTWMAWARIWLCSVGESIRRRRHRGLSVRRHGGQPGVGRRVSIRAAMLTSAVCLLTFARVAPAHLSDDPFDNAQLAPEDTRVFVSVVGGRSLLGKLSDTSVAEGLLKVFERSDTGRAWQRLAQSAGRDSRVLFDKLLGNKFVLIMLEEADPEDKTAGAPVAVHDDAAKPDPFAEWIAIAEVDQRTAEEVVQAFNARVLDRKDGISILTSEDGRLRLAYRDNYLYLCTSGLESRFWEFVNGKPLARTLEDCKDFKEARCCQEGQIGVFVRQQRRLDDSQSSEERPGRPRSTWLSLSVSIQPDGALVRWRFPTRTTPPSRQDDAGVTNRFDPDGTSSEDAEQTVWAVLDSVTRQPGVVYAGVLNSRQDAGRPFQSSAGNTVSWLLRRAAGSAGEQVETPAAFAVITVDAFSARRRRDQNQSDETRQADTSPIVPAFHIGLLVGDVFEVSAGLDEYILSTLRLLESHWRKQSPDTAGLVLPDTGSLEPHVVRRVDLSPRTRLIASWPGADSLSLTWRSRRIDPSTPAGLWACSTDEQAQSRILDRLSCTLLHLEQMKSEAAAPADARSWNRRIWDDHATPCDTPSLISAGMIRARSVARLLASWPAVNAESGHPLYRELYDYRLLLEGVSKVYWRTLLVTSAHEPEMTTPTVPRIAIQTEVQIKWSDSSVPLPQQNSD